MSCFYVILLSVKDIADQSGTHAKLLTQILKLVVLMIAFYDRFLYAKRLQIG